MCRTGGRRGIRWSYLTPVDLREDPAALVALWAAVSGPPQDTGSGAAAVLFSGFLIPLAIWPDGIREVVYVLPFASMVAIPIDVLLGKLQGADLLAALALQAFWAVAMLTLGRLVLSAALHKLVVQGG